MSIIEKALSKQKELRQGTDGKQDEDGGSKERSERADSRSQSTVEQAMARVHASQAETADAASARDAETATAHATPESAAEAPDDSQRPAGPVTTQQYTVISRERLARMGLLNPDGERGQVAEEFRLIKRPLLTNAFATGDDAIQGANLIMVTSALPREGKSFCTINLALSIAMEFDRTVLLVDADVARPSVLEYLDIQASGPGLLDILADDTIDFPDALIRTDVDKLTILPAGKTYPRATEMLASAKMGDLVREMSTRYPDRIILFDTPPLLATSEAGVLAHHMGQIVFVVESESTPQDAAVRAVEQLEGCEVVLPMLNKACPLPGMRNAYGYYGTYGG